MKSLFQKIYHKPFFIKLSNWEYWPFHVVYALIYPVYLWYCIRAGNLFFCTNVNPSIENGGFVMESKKKIYDLIPHEYKPFTLFFEPQTSAEIVLLALEQSKLKYPLIIKPDIGEKGLWVKKIDTTAELLEALTLFPFPFLIQPYINYENELGLFYVKHPNESLGKITGIVKKEFVKITGDGVHTIRALLLKAPRYILQIDQLEKICATEMETILPKGITQLLLPFGNHARGSLFLDASHWVDEQLQQTFNKICNNINGFYFGRLDIKYESFELLKQGKSFSIIELNGAGSEPTHIYDPNHSIFFAWKEIIRHWKILFRISLANKQAGYQPINFKQGLQLFKERARYQKLLELSQ